MTLTDVQTQTIVLGAQAVLLLGTLWVAFWQGKRTLDNLRTQTGHLQTSMQNGAYQSVISKEIDLITKLGEDAQLAELFDASPVFPWQNVNPEERRKRWFCISRLEVFELVFLQYHSGAISEDMWQPWKNYVQSMLQIPLFKEVWDKLQSFYHPEFIRSVSVPSISKSPQNELVSKTNQENVPSLPGTLDNRDKRIANYSIAFAAGLTAIVFAANLVPIQRNAIIAAILLVGGLTTIILSWIAFVRIR